MARALRVPALLAALGLLLTSPGQATPYADVASVWASSGHAGHNLRGSRQVPWWLQWLPDAVVFYLHWVPQLEEMYVRVRDGANVSSEDPLWKEAAGLVYQAANETQPVRHFMALCREGPPGAYANETCAVDRVGTTPIDGIPVAAYVCGSTAWGINWTRSWGNFTNTQPMNPLCNATLGTAYNETGVCGRSSVKQLVMAAFLALPAWIEDPVALNVPSLHCLLGLGDCHIRYCQACPGTCSPE